MGYATREETGAPGLGAGSQIGVADVVMGPGVGGVRRGEVCRSPGSCGMGLGVFATLMRGIDETCLPIGRQDFERGKMQTDFGIFVHLQCEQQ